VGFLHFKRGVSTLIELEILMAQGLEGSYNSYNSYNSYKRKKSKIKGYGTRFARVVSKAKSKTLIMYSLRSYFLKSKSFKVRTHSGCSVTTV
jgi:hypothetical protein